MADYYMAFILTDSVMKKIAKDDEDKEIVKRENIVKTDGSIPAEFVPFNAAYIKGETDIFGKMCDYVKGDSKSIVVGGNTLVGAFAIPWEETYTVGDNFTADHIFELIKEGSHRKQGYAKIEKIIVCKTKNDTDEIVNYFAEVNAAHGRPIKYAEEGVTETNYGDYSPPAATQAAEEDEYEAFLMREAEFIHPPQRNYQNTV
jgi:hypothetical protein